jgi:formamidopyrimidine-DNA glycosylase
LLNQAVISGLGNIYADEALFAAGVHPCRPAGGLTPEEAAKLHEKIDLILREAIRLRGSTRRDYVGLDGRAGRYQQRHQVYGQAGEACPVCGRALERLIVAGRSTHLCACCQPAGPA